MVGESILKLAWSCCHQPPRRHQLPQLPGGPLLRAWPSAPAYVDAGTRSTASGSKCQHSAGTRTQLFNGQDAQTTGQFAHPVLSPQENSSAHPKRSCHRPPLVSCASRDTCPRSQGGLQHRRHESTQFVSGDRSVRARSADSVAA